MIKIISDSTSDLSADMLEKYEISILPLHVHLGDEEYEDGVNISPEEIYRWSDEHKATPKTAAASIADTMDLMEQLAGKENELICFSISDNMSTTGNVMRMAAEELGIADRVSVINSENLSTGIGLEIIEAALQIKKGRSRTEIVASIEEMRPKVRASFVVDTLTYLHRGGRCSGVAALAGSVLKLHPKIVVSNGKMEVAKKYRGKTDSVIMTYVKDMEQELLHARKDRVFITHSGCDAELLKAVRTYLKELDYFDEILETRAGSVISSHCGPGTLGVLFVEG